MDYDYEIIDAQTLADGFLKLRSLRLRHRLFAGGWGQTITRECLQRGEVAAVLPYDPIRDEVILVEQFRVGALSPPSSRGTGPWLLETVAGAIEAGEQAAEVAHREALEEAGCRLAKLELICEYWVSPGMTSEYVTLYCGQADTQGAGGLFGLAEEDEDIRAQPMTRQAALAALAEGRIQASPAIIALQWLALNHERLRRHWA